MAGSSAGKVAVVTGAGSGIGRAVALAFQADGYNVSLAGRRIAELEATKALAVAGGGEMLAQACDVADALQVKSLFKATVQASCSSSALSGSFFNVHGAVRST